MSKFPDPATLTLAQKIDRACDRFEAAWQAGKIPKIEDFLAEIELEGVPQLLRSLLKVEIELIGQEGQLVSTKTFDNRFEKYTDLVAEVLEEHLQEGEQAETRVEEVRRAARRK